MICKVYTDVGGIKELYHVCHAKARGPSRTGGQPIAITIKYTNGVIKQNVTYLGVSGNNLKSIVFFCLNIFLP